MSRRPRRRQKGVIGTLLVELSAFAGIFGIAQPAVRNNLWQMVQPATIPSSVNQLAPQEFGELATHPESYAPTSYVTDSDLSSYPSAFTAQAVLPPRSSKQPVWSAAGYNPMGSYQ